ncbi:hypothetical protein MES5069_70150 [Mesorhizobium escarrei]|uniref:Uncharacterized protein n=1 Tax=Mesorhizobium escarrei TaxID=666018 RepID=A0ABN8KIA2_9HYPH|nr:hypothetical protein MES5069_70150 [Mesorhizobium escarrei]
MSLRPAPSDRHRRDRLQGHRPALKGMGYRGPVGMEAFASGDPEVALGLPRSFTV